MSRNSIMLIAAIAVIVVIMIALASMNTEVPTKRIEAPVTSNNAAPQP